MGSRLKKGLILVLGLLVLLLPFTRGIADSGWDSSYSGGGGGGSSYSGGGSSYHSSSSSSSHSSSSSGSYSSVDGLYVLIMFVVIIILVIIFSKSDKTKSNLSKFGTSNNHYSMKLMTPEEVSAIDPTLSAAELVPKVFDLFVEVQKAWTDFDYDKLRSLLGDELFNNYKMQLETLELEFGKNIMDNFTFIDGGILSVTKTDLTEEVRVKLHVQMTDYVINTKTNEVKHGDKNKVMDNNYVITLERSLREEIHNCPNCGGELKDTASQKCPYCDAVLVKGSKDFVIVKKENVKGMYY